MKNSTRKPKLFRGLKLMLGLAALGLVILTTSCGDDDGGGGGNSATDDIVDVAIANGYNVLAAALTEADLVSTLQGPGPFTVFAPTDDAFNDAGITVENVGDISTEDLAAILTYHVVSGNITSSDLTTGDVASVEGTDLSIDAEALTVNGVNIVDPFDVTASNGVIHTIDAVLSLPTPQPEESDIVQTAIDAGYNVLAAALTEAGLVSTLQGEGPFTVFAPTDDAFNDAGITVENVGDIDEDELVAILTYHVVSGLITSEDLATELVVSLEGTQLDINADDLTVNGTSIVEPFDVSATNGVIHTVDEVLEIPDIVDIAIANGYSILAEALVAAELVETLQGEGPFTVFAPTDDAFEDLLVELNISKEDLLALDNLADILTYHVVSGNVTSGDLTTGLVETVQGVNVDIDATALTVNDANISEPFDVKASNGVIHTIDAVLLIPDVVDVAVANNYSILAEALTAANLITTLQGDGPFTIFAPTDQAFADLLVELDITKEQLLAREDLADILLYHVVTGPTAINSDILTNGNLDTALDGAQISVNVDELTINDANLIAPIDVLADNGIIHTIDAVLLPPVEVVIIELN